MSTWFVGIALTLVLVVIIVGTLRKTRWGINPRGPRTCPGCERAHMGVFRKPASLGEALWGGRTCDKCGTRVDKWGRAIGKAA